MYFKYYSNDVVINKTHLMMSGMSESVSKLLLVTLYLQMLFLYSNE